MEQYLGRLLTKDEFVHHIDGNKQNNHIDNLVMVTAKQHSMTHKELKRELWRLIKENQKLLTRLTG
jgi:hypothetical protein